MYMYIHVHVCIVTLCCVVQVFQGLLRAHKDYHDTKERMARLWIHECYRVFADRMVGNKDYETFTGLVGEKLGGLFNLSFNNLLKNKQLPIFGTVTYCTCT